MDEEKKQKIEKWMYFIPVTVEVLWMIWIYPVYAFLKWEEMIVYKNHAHLCSQTEGNLIKIDLFIMVVTLILSIVIGRNLKKANYKIEIGTRILTIIIYIILVMITFFIPIYNQCQ